MVTFFKDSLERKTSGLFLQRFCGFVLGQSSYDVVFLSALAACSGENRLCTISRQSVLTLTLDSFKDKGTWWKHNIRNGMLLTFKVVFVSVVFLAFAVELKCK